MVGTAIDHDGKPLTAISPSPGMATPRVEIR